MKEPWFRRSQSRPSPLLVFTSSLNVLLRQRHGPQADTTTAKERSPACESQLTKSFIGFFF